MTLSRLFLFIIILFSLFILPSSAFTDTVQRYPNAVIDDFWNVETSAYGYVDIVSYPAAYPSSNSIRMYCKTPGSYLHWEPHDASITTPSPISTQYFGFVVRNYWQSVTTSPQSCCIKWYDTDGYFIDSADIKSYLIGGDDGSFVFAKLGNDISLYINGELKGVVATVPDSNAYVRIYFQFNAQGSYPHWAYIIIDDISTDSVLGLNADWTEVQPNIDTSYYAKSMFSFPDAEYKLNVINIYSGTTINSTVLPSNESVDTPYGFVRWDRPTIFGTKYGLYRLELTRDGTTLTDTYFTYLDSTVGGSVSFDRDKYVKNSDADVSYTISAPNYVVYTYILKMMDMYGNVKDTTTLTSDSKTITYSLNDYSTGLIFAVLTRTEKTTGVYSEIAYDVATIGDDVEIEGYTIFALDNTPLNTTDVSYLQSTTYYNTTSADSGGFYSLSSLTVGVNTEINASKINYTHECFSFTPPMSYLYTVNLYLFSTNTTRTSAAVEGMVVDYPLHQSIPNATVNIYNDTWSNTTTATSWGYYVFDNLSVDNSTMTNETFNSSDYDTWVTLANTDLLSGTILVSNLTDEVPFILSSDYEMNYTDGSIKVLSAGNMTNWTDYHIDYNYYIPTTYHVNATKDGYDNSTEYDVVVTNRTWTIQNIVLNQAKLLTVTAIDSETGNPILNFTASVDSMTTTVGDGDAEFYLNWGLYTVTVTSTGYYSNSKNVLMDQNRSVEISLTKIDSEYYVPHYVKFTVWGLFGYYEDVDVSVYKYGETDTEFTGVTGADGSVTFKLSETQRYRITFISSSQGINKEMILYPVEDSYLVFISSTSSWDEYSTPMNEAIDIDVTTAVINSTAAYVNVSYNDTLQQTTVATVYLNQTNNSDPYNQTVISSQDGFSNNWTHSFIVTNYTGESYYIHVVATHTTYETIDKTYAVSFNDDIIFDGIPSKFFLYLSIFIMLFTGAMFGAQSVGQGSMIVCVEGWVFLVFGWFNSIDSGLIMAGLGFATVFSLIYLINQKTKKEGV